MSEKCRNKVLEVFRLLDVDDSKSIDKKEAEKHWKGAFGKISAMEFFSAVDENDDGEVTLDEFIHFWETVKKNGNSEENIMEELENLKNGENWVGFENMQPVNDNENGCGLLSGRKMHSERVSSRHESK